MMNYLIVGLGNPGDEYDKTRHNLGFQVVRALADAHGFTFRHSSHLMGELAKGELHDKKIFLLLPKTYMNSSGDAVRRCVDYYQVPIYNILIVCDDVALPLGTMRIRAKGSAGGHNGLKSVETHLGTQHYARLRCGVGSPTGSDLADYVLSSFSPEEKPVVAEEVKKAQAILERWMRAGIAEAMQEANARDD